MAETGCRFAKNLANKLSSTCSKLNTSMITRDFSMQTIRYSSIREQSCMKTTKLAARLDLSLNQRRNYMSDRTRDFTGISLSSLDKHVVHIELNKPKSKNAFGLDSANELVDALRLIQEDSTARCLILSGNGPNFTSGVDIKSFMTVYAQLGELNDPARKAKLLLGIIETFQRTFKTMHSFGKPIICVSHGLCYGLGMELAGCSDIRYCSGDTKFSIREVLIGIAADVGSLQIMPRLTSNQSLLRELIYTGRDLTMEEVKELGLVSKILPSKEKAISSALQTAKIIASRSPVAIQGSKRNLQFSEDKSFSTGLDYNAIWNMSMMQASDIERAIAGILTKADQVEYEDF